LGRKHALDCDVTPSGQKGGEKRAHENGKLNGEGPRNGAKGEDSGYSLLTRARLGGGNPEGVRRRRKGSGPSYKVRIPRKKQETETSLAKEVGGGPFPGARGPRFMHYSVWISGGGLGRRSSESSQNT